MNGKILLVSYWLFVFSSSLGNVDVSYADTWSPPIALQHIGYNGTWERFCDVTQINKDFRAYPYHEMKRLRLMICDLKKQRNITRDSLAPFVGYKYCVMMRRFGDDIVNKLIDKFSLGDDEKKAELLAYGPIVDATACFRKVAPAFEKLCVAEMNPFFRMFHQLLARACIVKWLTTENVLSHLEQVCAGKRLSSEIDWRTIIDSIYIREK